MKKSAFLVLALAVSLCTAWAQEQSAFSLELQPQLSLPVGRDVDVFTMGGGGSVFARYSLPKLPYFAVKTGGGVGLVPVSITPGKSISEATMRLYWPFAGAEVAYSPTERLRLSTFVSGGYYFTSLNADVPNDSGSNPLLAGGVGIDFAFSPTLSVGLGAEYRNFLGLYNDIAFRIGTSYHFRPKQAQGATPYRSYPDLLIEEVTIDPMFPVLFKYYGENPVGTVRIKNSGKIPMEDLKVQFSVKHYMDNPTSSVVIPFLKGGEELTLDVLALFNDTVLTITEATKVQASATVLATVAGKQYGEERVETLRMYDRNAITWIDDRRVAAFVSAKDPDVMRFSKNVASTVKGHGPLVYSEPLLDAIALHGAISLYGVNYQVDPSTPYTEFSADATAIDYLQFPGQSLQFKAGDCDDLSILYASLLEALGIQTAFITTPGHIYIAFDSGLVPSDINNNEQRAGRYIMSEDTVWIPLEVTLTKDDFLKAWETGAQAWRQAGDSARLYPVHDAWKLYEPVGFAGTGGITLPSSADILELFERNVAQLVDRDLTPQVSILQRRLKNSPNDARLRNSLGILYARYGYTQRARAEFDKVLKQREYFPAIINLANIEYMAGRLPEARDLYLRAGNIRATSPLVSLGLARVNYDLADYDAAHNQYEKLKREDPTMASSYPYLAASSAADAATRAADAEKGRTRMQWSDE